MHENNLNNNLTNLLNQLAVWPEWKLNAMLLDESDLVVKKVVMEYKNNQNMLLEKIDDSSVHHGSLPYESTKKLVKTK